LCDHATNDELHASKERDVELRFESFPVQINLCNCFLYM